MITLKELAQKLNVSISTVSKALNDSSEISPETINRVKKVATHYNYRPNKIAQSLKRNETRTIGVIIPDILNRFFAKVLYGIEKEAANNGYQIITCISDELLSKEQKSVKLLTNGSVDGLIMAVSEETLVANNFEHINNLISTKTPLVLIDRVVDQVNCDKVAIDDFEAALKATQKLIKLGRKQIAFLSTIDNLNVGKLREQGFKEAMSKLANSGEENLIFRFSEDTRLQQRLVTMFKEHPQIDGILAADNISGTMAISVANSLGYQIPKDVSIIGFSDSTISQLTVPKLSYINQQASLIGQNAMQLLMKRLNGELNEFTTQKTPIHFEGKASIHESLN